VVGFLGISKLFAGNDCPLGAGQREPGAENGAPSSLFGLHKGNNGARTCKIALLKGNFPIWKSNFPLLGSNFVLPNSNVSARSSNVAVRNPAADCLSTNFALWYSGLGVQCSSGALKSTKNVAQDGIMFDKKTNRLLCSGFGARLCFGCENRDNQFIYNVMWLKTKDVKTSRYGSQNRASGRT
jgi:hypothetical protein